jgi:hypothetical protein
MLMGWKMMLFDTEQFSTTNRNITMQQRPDETTAESQLQAPAHLDALEFLQGKTIDSVTRIRTGGGDGPIILSFTDGTFAEFQGLTNWGDRAIFDDLTFGDTAFLVDE